MTMAALSPSSLLASPAHVNPQVKTAVRASEPQVAQDAQRVSEATQTDTITISPQALKMADDKNALAKEAANSADEQQALQQAKDKAAAIRNDTQKNAVKAYAA